jgi:hypothetical protein
VLLNVLKKMLLLHQYSAVSISEDHLSYHLALYAATMSSQSCGVTVAVAMDFHMLE